MLPLYGMRPQGLALAISRVGMTRASLRLLSRGEKRCVLLGVSRSAGVKE
jgi:hypothetical protein